MEETKPLKVRVVGQYFGTSGYANHVRGLAQGLLLNGLDVRVGTQKPQDWQRWCTDIEVKMLNEEPSRSETMVYVGLPPFWRFALAERPKHFIGFLVWEGDSIPTYWLEYIEDMRVDQIWVPSKHVLDAMLKTAKSVYGLSFGGWEKVKIVPHGYDPAVYRSLRGDLKALSARQKRPFTFIANKGLVDLENDRGGLQYAIKAFYEEFKAGEPVRFVIKINGAYLNVDPAARQNWCRETLFKLGVAEHRAPIMVTADDIPASDMPGFYSEGDVFVSTNRCDGFNLPGLEAKACGLPTMQTGFGGQTDYMTEDVDITIGYDLVPVTHEVLYEGVQWATPHMDKIRYWMRWCFNHQDEIAERARKAPQSVSGWTWEDTGRKALEALKLLR